MSMFDNLPSLIDRPRGGWPDTQAKAKTRLETKVEKIKDDSKDEKKAKAAVWKLDGGCCRWCKRKVQRVMDLIPARAEFHHVSGRVVIAIRWDVRNLILLCLECHERLTGTIGEKFVIVSRAVFAVDGVEYINARKTVRFKRVA